jgi:hypothetical protein
MQVQDSVMLEMYYAAECFLMEFWDIYHHWQITDDKEVRAGFTFHQ